jgi:penicillin-insensitive murein endopeptidase
MKRALDYLRLGVFCVVAACSKPPEVGFDSAPASPARPLAVKSAPEPHASSEPIDDEPAASPVDDEPETVEDDPEDEHDAPVAGEAEARPHPLDGWTEARIDKAVAEELASLGSISLGQPSGGLLLNGVQAVECEHYKPVAPAGAFGTDETLRYLAAALTRVHREFPGTEPLSLGHISGPRGGRLSPHVSHQSGRDVDISFFYSSNAQWYRRGTAENLDRARNWAFVRALIMETDVEMILVDQSILNLLREYAAAQGEDPAWLESIFRGGGGQRAILRHAPGHATHFHIRFYNPIAQETGRRAYQHLVAHGLVPPVQDYIRYKAKKGDTLGKIAKRFGSSIPALKKANALKKSLIREKQVYLIPVKNSRPRAPLARLSFPPRRLPPTKGP